MTIEERKSEIINQIENLSEEQLTTFEKFFYGLVAQEETSEEEREEKIKSIIKNDFSRFKETFKALS
ncbi:hypothetical protein [Bernardetia sp. MNP-M8]|uniref:hypothetical protein n=1 Tax=Bernardetia sp. MNP-M8 TaxID=3127470 RepID=UPI0030CEA618